MKPKIILFGGTFDPVHIGHVKVARSALKQIGADKLIFIPANRSPHKKNSPRATPKQRYEMIELAVRKYDNIEISDCEFKRQGPSYSFDTVMYFLEKYDRNCDLYLLVGADAIKDLCKWYRIKDLIDNCFLSVMRRGGEKPPDFTGLENKLGHNRRRKLEKNTVNTPSIEISSTEIRKRVAQGMDISDVVCPEVAEYIKKHDLYR